MRRVPFGRSGLVVSEAVLGTMTFGTRWGIGAEPADAQAMASRFAEAGGNFVDTADGYNGGESETILGPVVTADRDHWVVGTKYGLRTGPGPNAAGHHRKHLRSALESSLRRLGTDHVDVLWVHAYDGRTPLEETLRAIDEQIRLGKVLHAAVSNTPAWVVSRADALARERGLAGFEAVQVEYSLCDRTAERELVPMAAALHMAFLAWSPLAGGLLTGKYLAAPDGEPRRLAEPSPLHDDTVRAVCEVARDLGATPAQVAVAWVVASSAMPILGARSPAQLEENLGALDITLPPAALERLDEASRVALGVPHEFLAENRALIDP